MTTEPVTRLSQYLLEVICEPAAIKYLIKSIAEKKIGLAIKII
jgi:hypothetical protein